MRRRRFLTIVAAAALTAGRVASGPLTWRGRALGADTEVTLIGGPPGAAQAALAAIPPLLAGIEAQFSLHDPGSTLARLNATGQASDLPPDFLALCAAADRAHALTGGLFDPTVQPLWQALAQGADPAPARALIGWHRVRREGRTLRLAPGQALTFNGIAQGHATDRVRDLLAGLGFTRALVNIGEFAALGGPWQVGLSDPVQGLLATRHLHGTAIATSSPGALRIGGASHILGPRGQAPLWSTVSVEAQGATLADALSTALVFVPRDRIAGLVARTPDLRAVSLVDPGGDLITL